MEMVVVDSAVVYVGDRNGFRVLQCILTEIVVLDWALEYLDDRSGVRVLQYWTGGVERHLLYLLICSKMDRDLKEGRSTFKGTKIG